MRWRRLFAAVTVLAASTGCNSILGNELYGLAEAGASDATVGSVELPPDAALADHSETSTRTDASDAALTDASDVAATDASDAHAADATLEASPVLDAEAAADQGADQNTENMEATTPTDSGTTPCTASGACAPNACQNGSWVCVDGGRVCQETSAIADGTPCVVAGVEAGAGASVCSGGQCVTCNAGGDCSDPATPCIKKNYDCSSGTAVCTATGPVSDGTGCGTGLYCNGGMCTACHVGTSCPPPGNACDVGKVTACTNGVATCTDQSMPAAAGTSCPASGGASGVCDGAGQCNACSAGAQCNPNNNPCQVGVQSCSAGAVCTMPTAVREAQTCNPGQICHNGSCVACDATSCPSGCCDTNGCVTSAQSPSECGSGSAGTACATCPGPTAGSGSSTCTNNACGVSCAASTPTLCGTACVNCTGGQVCVSSSSQCACPSNTLNCNGMCESPSPANSCGSSCTKSCPGPNNGSTGSATCNGSMCAVTCNAATPTNCTGACVDLTSDSGNCGRCGHPCQGGTCVASVCQPVAIVAASSTNYPYALAVDASYVYWVEQQDGAQNTNQGSIKKAPLAGGGSFTLLANGQPAPQGIAVNSTGVFWINFGATGTSGGLMFLAASASTPVAVATAYTEPVAITVSSSTVYWIDDTTSSNGHNESLLSLPMSPASALVASATPSSLTNAANCALSMAVNGNSVFWLESGCFAGSGLVEKTALPVSGSSVVDLLPSSTFLNGPYNNAGSTLGTAQARIGLDANNVYFSSTGASSDSLQSVPIGGGGVSTLSSTAMPNGVTVDANNVYWTDVSTVMAMPIGGGSATTLAKGQTIPYDIVVDSTSVYWVNYAANGGVMKVAKP